MRIYNSVIEKRRNFVHKKYISFYIIHYEFSYEQNVYFEDDCMSKLCILHFLRYIFESSYAPDILVYEFIYAIYIYKIKGIFLNLRLIHRQLRRLV